MLEMLVPTLLLAIMPRASYSQPGSDTKVCQAQFWSKTQKSLKSYQPQDQLVDSLDIDNQYNI